MDALQDSRLGHVQVVPGISKRSLAKCFKSLRTPIFSFLLTILAGHIIA